MHANSRRRTTVTIAAFAIAIAIALPRPAAAGERDDLRWGLAIWGLSYHVDRAVNYDEANLGVGLRFYLNHLLFVEADALKNSNRGIVLPASIGVELSVGSVSACRVSVVGAATVAYYQNPRTASDYYKVGPVPGAAVTCGRFKTNVVAILSPSHQPLAAIVLSVVVLF